MNMAQASPEAAIPMLESLVKLYQPESPESIQPNADAPSGSVHANHDDTPERRARCVQLAKQQLNTLRDDLAKQASRQLAVIQERLTAAGKIAAGDPARAREMLQAIVDLYGKETWAADAVAEAQRQLEALPPAPKD